MSHRQAAPFPLRMDEEIREWVKERSDKDSRSMNKTITHLLRKAMQHDKQTA